jgi:uncharacterized protein YggE
MHTTELISLLSVSCNYKIETVVQPSGQPTGVNVSGVGRAVGTPDVVILQLGVNAERSTVDAAREAAARALQSIIDTLKANGVADRDIQTLQFSIQPQYDFTGGAQRLRAYRVVNVVTARVHKLENAGKAIDDAARAGGNDAVVQSVQFTIDDPAKLQSEAREEAVKQAHARAEALADHAGVKLGRPISITESPPPQQGPQPLAAPRTAAESALAQTPIQAGELEVVVTVNVVYAVE